VQALAQSVLEFIRRQKLVKAGDRVGVAVSGGADWVALLRLLLELRGELGAVLSVVHLNHKLRAADSAADEQFVAEVARKHKLEFRSESGEVAAYAAEKHLGLEATARELRYEYFRRLLGEGVVNRIATAHTLDDQAETVLLKVARGAGPRGLAGIYPQLARSGGQFADSQATIIRPLLKVQRRQIEAYLAACGQDWREDKSNRDVRHARNRVRHGILPRLERYLNPAVREALAETAELARADEEYLASEVARVLPQLMEKGGSLRRSAVLAQPLALQRRAVRAVAEALGLRLEFRHVEEILGVASGGARSPKSAMLPGGWMVWRKQNELQFGQASSRTIGLDYEYRLAVPGRVEVPEAGSSFEATLVPGNAERGYNREHLLDPALLAKELQVRNWRAGDRFWPAHTKSSKKIKELLQERHVTGAERKLWPVVASETVVVWVRGFPPPAQLRWQEKTREAVAIREMPL
jgi:tRNA(Ile)-lysidine synthase